MNWPLVAVHTIMLANGKLLVFDAWETNGTPSARLWDPQTQAFTPVPNGTSELFCAGHAQLGDGRLLVIGGHNGAEFGIRDANIFDPATNRWIPAADMHYPRWYPTAVTLTDGRVLALGGQSSPGVYVTVPEVYDPATNTWTELSGASLNIWEYPFSFIAPDGRVFVTAGPDLRSRLLNVSTQSWTTLATAPVSTGTSVMYLPGKVMAAGGGTNNADPVQRGTAVIDLNQANPSWRQTAPMAEPRFEHDLVVLPDGSVIAVGGSRLYSLVSTDGALSAERWDPATETWTTMAAMQVPRMYHSTAVLLPDGRVLSAGGGRAAPAVDYANAQIYSPPYLFKGARPTIQSAPGTVGYGGAFGVQTPDAASIASVALVRMGSSTHSLDFDQRYVPLTFTANAGGLSVSGPANAATAPPGTYMLFIVNGNGVPSVASIVRVGGQPPADSQAPSVTLTAPDAGATVSGSAVTISATASDDTGVVSVQFLLDGQPLGGPDTAAPYAISWDTRGVTNGAHTLSARATDAAGNQGTASSLTVTVTNATADTTPPQLAAIAAANVGTTAATIGWTTDELATSQVEYGTTTAYGSTTTLDSALVTSHSVPLGGLTPNVTYHYRVLSRDAAGNLATSGDATFTTTADGAAPLISAVQASGVLSWEARISWTTDEPSTTQVEYGTTTAYGATTPLDQTLVTTHAQLLLGLEGGTLYHYRVVSRDAAGNVATSADGTFTTNPSPAPTIDPLVTNPPGWNPKELVVYLGETVTWRNDATMNHTTTSDTGVWDSGVLTTGQTFTYTFTTPGYYHYHCTIHPTTMGSIRVLSIPAPDTTPPMISAVSAGSLTTTSARISWTTDEPATSQVRYGPTTSYGSQTTLDATLLTNHAQTLSGLIPDTLYNVQVVSRDAAGNEAVSANATFRTAPVNARSALAFNGANQYVSVPDRTSLRITTNLTAEAWIRPTSASGHRHIVGKNYWELSIEPSGTGYRALFEFRGGGRWRSVASGTLPFNQWTHVAGTYNGSVLRLFVNGALVASLNTTGAIDQTARALRIGSADASGDFFAGRIDEVRVSSVVRYTGAFTPSTTPFAADASTRGLWHFSEGSGTTAADASSNGNHGTLINGPGWVTDSPLAAGAGIQLVAAATGWPGTGPTGGGHHQHADGHAHAPGALAAPTTSGSGGSGLLLAALALLAVVAGRGVLVRRRVRPRTGGTTS